jgi:hypothetical protein
MHAMKDTTPARLYPPEDPSRRLLVRVPARPDFLAVLATACRIYCHTLPDGSHLFADVARAVSHAATRAGSGTTTHVETEFRINDGRLEVSIGDEVLHWEMDASAS